MSRVRVLLADDHQMLADALRSVLEESFDVVGTVTDGRALLEAASSLRPDVIVLDIGMPQLNGLDAGRQISKAFPKVKLIYLTMNEDPYLISETFRAGGSAFLLKQGAAFELTDAIQKVLDGGTYLTPSADQARAHHSLRPSPTPDSAPEPTPRQREVIQLLAEGRSMKEIATTLNISTRTVAAHKYAVMELLNFKSNAELVRYAMKRGMISN